MEELLRWSYFLLCVPPPLGKPKSGLEKAELPDLLWEGGRSGLTPSYLWGPVMDGSARTFIQVTCCPLQIRRGR